MRGAAGAVALALLAGGCATVTRGMTEDITFTSEPSGAEMRTSTGITCTTPCTLKFNRRGDFIATFRVKGYPDMQIPVITEVPVEGAAGVAGNVLIGGVIGVGVDVATGAALSHTPNPVHADFRAPPPPPEPAKTPKPAAIPTPAAAKPTSRRRRGRRP